MLFDLVILLVQWYDYWQYHNSQAIELETLQVIESHNSITFIIGSTKVFTRILDILYYPKLIK